MIQFQGFKPESMPKIANSLGYKGDMQNFQQYLDQNKDKQDMMNQYMQKAQQMANGGVPSKHKGFSKHIFFAKQESFLLNTFFC